MISIWVLVVAAVAVAVLLTALLFTIKSNIRLQADVEYSRGLCLRREQDLDICQQQCRGLEKEISFQDGLRAGRRTDTLYQQLLKKFTDKEQFTVMMNGLKEGDEK